MYFIYPYFLLIIVAQPNYLLTINPTTNLINYNIANNGPGLSLDWNVINIIDNPIFTQLITNLILQTNMNYALNIAIKPSKGSGYKCDPIDQAYCTHNISSNDLNKILTFYSTYTRLPKTFAGLQFERINNTQILTFMNDANNITKGFIYQFGQNVDNYAKQGFRPSGYDINSYLAQIQTFMNTSSPVLPLNLLNFAGPGIDIKSKGWMNNMSIFFDFAQKNKYNGIFTIKMNYFQNDTDCTINNLLSEKYLTQRFQNAFQGYETFIRNYNVALTTMKIHPSAGMDSVTNTFAATVWAVDFIMTWISMGGYSINFDFNLSANNFQSPITSSSNFSDPKSTKINSIYYALYTYVLFTFNLNSPIQVSINTVTNNQNNYNIKVWSISDSKNINLLILNKDTNSNLSGKVQIVANNYTSAQYFYISASTLMDTSNFTILGYTFDNSTTGIPSSITGNQTIFDAIPDGGGMFNIPLSYSQILIVYLPYSYGYTTYVDSSTLYERQLIVLLGIGALLFLIIMN